MRAMRSRLSVLSAIVPILALMAVSGCPISDVIPDGGGGTDTGRQLSSAPTVVLTADVVRGIAPLTVRFDSAGSTDDGLIVSRNWDFGDDQTSMGHLALAHVHHDGRLHRDAHADRRR